MNETLRDRILRHLEPLPDERAYQVLDYIEFLESRFGTRSQPTGLLARITETVEDTMRAGKIPIKAISGTISVVDSAGRVMKGLAAAGKAVVDEAVKAAEGSGRVQPPAPSPQSIPPASEPPPGRS
ncbi:MAG TPA: hypothetical protein VLT17_01375 [Gemmatimonadales bacterium]|jgi:hypothetical protein|nr:hypothetical protein [Gemmatimonadales bacterium]